MPTFNRGVSRADLVRLVEYVYDPGGLHAILTIWAWTWTRGTASCPRRSICASTRALRLYVLIRKYKDDIRRANMRKVNLVTDTTELYTPSSFYYQDNQYAWEIVSRVYDSMDLIAQNKGACSNVQRSVNMIDKAIEDHTSLGHIKCPSQVVRFYVFYVAKVRSIAIMLANMALTFAEAVWNMFLAIIALFIETLQDYKLFEGQSGVAFFINRAFNLVLKTLNYARKFSRTPLCSCCARSWRTRPCVSSSSSCPPRASSLSASSRLSCPLSSRC